jgi:hypothetical protein
MQACVGEPEFTPGEDVWAGCDVGGERSASAVVWINERLHVGCAIYHGDEGVLECVDKARELAGEFNLREFAYDPWRLTQGALELEREGITVTAWPQTDVRMVPASGALYRAIVERRLTLPDTAELRQHAAASHDSGDAEDASTKPAEPTTSTSSSRCAWRSKR